MRHCIIEYGYIGLDAVSSTSPVIEDNVISHHGNIGINLTGDNIEELICIGNEVYDNNIGIKYLAAYGLQGGVVSFIRNTIYGNIGDGIYISTFPNALANVTIRGNNIYNNGSNGVECYASYDGRSSKINLVISNNEIHNNSGSGIYSERGDSFCSVGATIIHNSIYCNNVYGIYCCDREVSIVNYNNLFNNVNYDLYNRNPLAIDGRYNWWGEAVTAEMDAGGNPKNISKIYDTYDNPGRGVVDYSSYVNESSVEINLLPGFNLISIPIVPADLKPSSVFHEITNLTGNLYKWNPQSQDWIVYNGSDEEFRNIEIGKAYKIYVDTPITLNIQGGANMWDWQELFHYTGRNLFGVPFVSNIILYLCTVENTVTGEILNISNAVQSGWIGNNLEWWDAATQTSQFIDLTGDLTGIMLIGSTGYWIDINLPNLILTLPSDSPVITDISIAPNPFSPDEDFINDTTTITMVLERPGFAKLNIYNEDGEFIKDIDLQRKDGYENTYESVWDGRDYTGTYIKNGIYTAYFDTGSILRLMERTITVNKYPLITDFSSLPNPFSPDEDGQNDTTTITFNLSEDSLLSVKVYNLSQELVRTIAEDLAVTAGDQTFIWDGLDEQGGELIAGRYVVKISAQSIFGGEINSVNLNVYIAFISDVLTPTDQFNPGGGENCFINYTLARDAIISIDLYNSEDNLVRHLLVEGPRTMGTFSEVWNGRDNNGDIVPDGVYHFIIIDSISGEPCIIYDPRGTGGQDISHSISLSVTTFNPARNIPCILSYNMPQSAEIIIKVRDTRYGGAAIKVIEYYVPKPQGQGTSVWDGRDELGQLTQYHNYTFAIWGYTLIDNAIIVAGKIPVIGNNITVEPISFSPKGSPYAEVNSTIFAYSLSRNCNITIKIYDSNNNLIRNLLTTVSRNEGTNNEVWDGHNNDGLLVPEGEYRIDIQGENEGNYSVVRSATVFIHY